ncbi:DUF421 domain-containing protein [Paenibacillus physcomitrellae]|uniref:DUF421 domain-containing protein n=1 Tax=Paenibacillus physcomitrellae TaxID=1619311 RepID=A0ABQ1FWH7_9BACL|nr:DUF421 domain-containing protein [Paenibacillus physcomitrellae]GGA31292.1 DUF421 domain-containing protein [Paenibacillus physcomitrellae]
MMLGEITLKLVIGFVGLWVMTRWLGKKEISQLTPFDFISSIMLSELVGNTIYDEETGIMKLLYSLLFWALLSFLFEKITQHFRKWRKVMDGRPGILIRHGKVDLKEMRRNSVDFDQLRMLLRQQNVFYIGDVDYAIFEASGTLSVMKKSASETVTRSDLHLPDKPGELSYNLIEDGEIVEENLELIGHGREWLMKKLEEQGYTDLGEIAYAEWQQSGGLYVLEHKEGSLKRPEGDI